MILPVIEYYYRLKDGGPERTKRIRQKRPRTLTPLDKIYEKVTVRHKKQK